MTTNTMTRCANPDCGEPLFDDPSDVDDRFCHNCGDLMPAWCPQPRYGKRPDLDEWERLYDGSLDDGAYVSGGQCGDCGSQAWVVRQRGSRSEADVFALDEGDYTGWVVVCEEDLDHADDPDYPEPCGAEYPVVMLPGRKIVW